MIASEIGQEQSHVDIIKKIYRDFLAGDIEAVLAAFADDIDWNSRLNWPGGPEELPYEGRRFGRSNVAEAFRQFRAAVVYEHPMADNRYQVVGNRVIVTGQDIRRVVATGERTENRWSMVWTFDEGKVVHFRIYQDTVPTLE